MNKLLTLIMIFCSVGCYAEIPNMKNYPSTKNTTKDEKVVFEHRLANYVDFVKYGDFKSEYFRGYDPLTKCTFTIHNLGNIHNEPFCTIEDKNGNIHKSSEYYYAELDNITGFYFEFHEKGIIHRFIFCMHAKLNMGFLQTFE